MRNHVRGSSDHGMRRLRALAPTRGIGTSSLVAFAVLATLGGGACDRAATGSAPSVSSAKPASSAVAPAAASADEPSVGCPGRVFTSFVDDSRSSKGDGLRVVINHPSEDTGTMHYASRVELRAAGASPLVFVEDMERGSLPPIFTRRYRIAEDRYLLLGWTSYGSGEQSDHAWIVARERGALRVAGKLELSEHRANALFVLHRAGARLRLGVPLPDDRPGGLGAPWIRLDDEALHESAAASLGATPTPAGGEIECHVPPFEDEEMSLATTRRFVWFEVTAGGFERPR